MNATNATAPERKHPLGNRVSPPLVVVLAGVAVAVVARFTPSVEIGSNVRFVGGAVAIVLGTFLVVQGAKTIWRNKTTINPVDIDTASVLVISDV